MADEPKNKPVASSPTDEPSEEERQVSKDAGAGVSSAQGEDEARADDEAAGAAVQGKNDEGDEGDVDEDEDDEDADDDDLDEDADDEDADDEDADDEDADDEDADDEDADDEDEEDDVADEDAPPVQRARRREEPDGLPRTEEELNTPPRQTLWMLGAVCVATLVMWGAGQARYNAHPPRQTLRPRDVTIEELARDPKNAAIEMEQRLATNDFKGALELAKGEMVEQVKQAEKRCADSGTCKEPEQLRGHALSTGTLLAATPSVAVVRVKTDAPGFDAAPVLLDVEREGRIWKVIQRQPDLGKEIEKLVEERRQIAMEQRAAAGDAGGGQDAAAIGDAGPGDGAEASQRARLAAPAVGKDAGSSD